jgi:holo-[acyl-carrier protein] synthase
MKAQMSDKSAILGLGNDIIEIGRISPSIERLKSHFLDKLFTEKEQAYCNQFKDQATHYAGRFAAKEAIAKAFGFGFGEKIAWNDIEILPDEFGKPIPYLSIKLKSQFNDPTILVSISHCTTHATAVAIWTE